MIKPSMSTTSRFKNGQNLVIDHRMGHGTVVLGREHSLNAFKEAKAYSAATKIVLRTISVQVMGRHQNNTSVMQMLPLKGGCSVFIYRSSPAAYCMKWLGDGVN